MQESVSIRDGKIRVQLFREGQGAPLVFLQGELGRPHPEESEFLKALSSRFTVYAPQHPGYGESQGIEDIDDIQDVAFYYFDMLDALGLEQPFLMGHSMGGMVAAEMATLCPHRAKRLVLVAPLGLWHDDFPVPDLFIIARSELRGRLFFDARSELALQVLPEDFPSQDVEMSFWQGLSAAGKLLWGLPYNPKLGKRLHRITVPTLLVWGEEDRLIHPHYGEMFQKGIKGAQRVIIRGCGHMPHLEKPQDFVREVSRFLI